LGNDPSRALCSRRFRPTDRPTGRTDGRARHSFETKLAQAIYALYFQRGKSEQDNFQGDKESGNHQHFIVTLPKKEGSLAAEPSPFVSLSLALAESANGFFSFLCPADEKAQRAWPFLPFCAAA
jgi:hypothetical protein